PGTTHSEDILSTHMITRLDAARLLSVSKCRVRQFEIEGKLKSVVGTDGVRFLDSADVEALRIDRLHAAQSPSQPPMATWAAPSPQPPPQWAPAPPPAWPAPAQAPPPTCATSVAQQEYYFWAWQREAWRQSIIASVAVWIEQQITVAGYPLSTAHDAKLAAAYAVGSLDDWGLSDPGRMMQVAVGAASQVLDSSQRRSA
ncbi:MAG: hypothetical protein V2A73_20525, partial [Pseudomonadota bacterium]